MTLYSHCHRQLIQFNPPLDKQRQRATNIPLTHTRTFRHKIRISNTSYDVDDSIPIHSSFILPSLSFSTGSAGRVKEDGRVGSGWVRSGLDQCQTQQDHTALDMLVNDKQHDERVESNDGAANEDASEDGEMREAEASTPAAVGAVNSSSPPPCRPSSSDPVTTPLSPVVLYRALSASDEYIDTRHGAGSAESVAACSSPRHSSPLQRSLQRLYDRSSPRLSPSAHVTIKHVPASPSSRTRDSHSPVTLSSPHRLAATLSGSGSSGALSRTQPCSFMLPPPCSPLKPLARTLPLNASPMLMNRRAHHDPLAVPPTPPSTIWQRQEDTPLQPQPVPINSHMHHQHQHQHSMGGTGLGVIQDPDSTHWLSDDSDKGEWASSMVSARRIDFDRMDRLKQFHARQPSTTHQTLQHPKPTNAMPLPPALQQTHALIETSEAASAIVPVSSIDSALLAANSTSTAASTSNSTSTSTNSMHSLLCPSPPPPPRGATAPNWPQLYEEEAEARRMEKGTQGEGKQDQQQHQPQQHCVKLVEKEHVVTEDDVKERMRSDDRKDDKDAISLAHGVEKNLLQCQEKLKEASLHLAPSPSFPVSTFAAFSLPEQPFLTPLQQLRATPTMPLHSVAEHTHTDAEHLSGSVGLYEKLRKPKPTTIPLDTNTKAIPMVLAEDGASTCNSTNMTPSVRATPLHLPPPYSLSLQRGGGTLNTAPSSPPLSVRALRRYSLHRSSSPSLSHSTIGPSSSLGPSSCSSFASPRSLIATHRLASPSFVLPPAPSPSALVDTPHTLMLSTHMRSTSLAGMGIGARDQQMTHTGMIRPIDERRSESPLAWRYKSKIPRERPIGNLNDALNAVTPSTTDSNGHLNGTAPPVNGIATSLTLSDSNSDAFIPVLPSYLEGTGSGSLSSRTPSPAQLIQPFHPVMHDGPFHPFTHAMNGLDRTAHVPVTLSMPLPLPLQDTLMPTSMNGMPAATHTNANISTTQPSPTHQ